MFRNLLVCCLMLAGTCLSQNSPVVMWGRPSFSKPTLQTVSREDFAQIVAPKLDDSMILVFLENGLETDDLSMCKTESQKSCFENFKTFNLRNYYADVELPFNVLQDIAIKKEFIKLNNSGDLSEPINYEIGKIVFMDLDDANEDRSKTLTDHDSTIANIYTKLSSFGKIFAVYTSKPMFLSRRARQAAGSATPTPIAGKMTPRLPGMTGPFMLAYGSLKSVNEKNEVEDITVNSGAATLKEKNMEVNLVTTKGKITFLIENKAGYWSINEIIYDNDIYESAIMASNDFSYYCGVNTFKTKTKTKRLLWNGLQMEPSFKDKITEIKKFNDPWHCVGFTSAGIWMGLFVSFLFLFIISIGVTWLMSINTMDRFDDPKGKTITINANE